MIKTILQIHGENASDILLLAHNQIQLGQKELGQITVSRLPTEASQYQRATDLAIANTELGPVSKVEKTSNNNLRCVIYSSNPAARVRISVAEPLKHLTSHYRPSDQGGILYRGRELREYLIRNALPGDYTFKCSTNQPTTVFAILYQHWGTAKQTVSYHTLITESRKDTELLKTSIDFQ